MGSYQDVRLLHLGVAKFLLFIFIIVFIIYSLRTVQFSSCKFLIYKKLSYLQDLDRHKHQRVTAKSRWKNLPRYECFHTILELLKKVKFKFKNVQSSHNTQQVLSTVVHSLSKLRNTLEAEIQEGS